ncbi:MAG TPA: hypothetical protein PKY81_17110 [bacterium]|nr:hypothetical protein [bacterium]
MKNSFDKKLFKKGVQQVENEFIELTEIILSWFKENFICLGQNI